LEEYQREDSRIKCYFNNQNIGFKKNFEKAIHLCSGDFIALADQDDIWTEDHLELLEQNISSNELICSSHKNIAKDGLPVRGYDFNTNIPGLLAEGNSKVFLFLVFHNFVQGCSMLMKRALAEKALPIPDEFLYHDHWLALVASIYGSIAYLDRVTVLYRYHEANVTNRLLEAKRNPFAPVTKKINDSQLSYQEWVLDNLLRLHSLYSIFQNSLTDKQKSICFKINEYLVSTVKKERVLKRLVCFIKYYKIIHWEDNITNFCFYFFRFLWKLIYRIFLFKNMKDNPLFVNFLKSNILTQDSLE
jgi:glycosyltransferase involved in cell wall biosynthesis